MACEKKNMSYFFIIFVVFHFHHMVEGEPQVPCFFIFGDSLVDAGNNNDLASLAKANFLPYGMDFPGGPSGRFCNGRTTADIITEHLGFDNFIPAFAKSATLDVVQGVNYASGSAGIKDETGAIVGDRFSLNAQLRNHQSIISRITSKLGNAEEAKKHLNRCLYYVGMGSNDFAGMLTNPTSFPTFIAQLVNQYSQQLTALYNLGARKVAVMGLWPLGCTPGAVGITRRCSEISNQGTQMFNNRVKAIVDQLNQQLPDAKFIYINAFQIFSDSYNGFRDPTTACCGNGPCMPLQPPCQDRDDHIFWDFVHPSQAMNKIMGGRAYKAQSPDDAYPYDISHLASL